MAFILRVQVVQPVEFHHLPIAYTACMPHVEKHAPGSFCWIELATTDQQAAKAFYTSLFGWKDTDSPMGPNAFYTTFTLDDRKAAACYALQPDELRLNIPAHWNLYVCVASADATTKRALESEGKVFCGPFDVMNHGRMSTIADPTGAVFSIWEPKDHPGIGVERQHASFCWADLSTPDPMRAAQFYQDLFGWTMRAGQENYLHIANAGEDDYIGGIPPVSMRQPNEPPHWVIYLQVDDCDAATAKAKELGAKVFAGPMTIEHVGRMTFLADPQGAVFALFQPEPH
jgi:predicted enzyme related to lactoylglutathione lyase